MRRKSLVTALAVLGLSAGANAQGSGQPEPCSSPPYEAFDFWLGEWTVTDLAEQPAGTNIITKEERGCLIVEHWTNKAGGTGQSYNYYDPGDKKWHQLWVSAGSVIEYSGGINQRGHMLLEGEIKYRNGTTFPFKGSWVPNDDGSVTQHFEQFNPETEEWDDWFIGTYRKS